MAIDPTILAHLAQAYTQGMTTIRGRRVQRLIRREFAGAQQVERVALDPGRPALMGVSPAGAALCATEGRGPAVAIVKWLHGATQGVETRFNLLKDSLPVTGEVAVDLAVLGSIPARASALSGFAVPGRVAASAEGSDGSMKSP
jgi:hypothetical protein